MKAAFIMPCRNKAPYVEAAVRSILDQTYSRMTVIISDQGSTDGSREIVRDLIGSYDGPNEVIFLDCPDTEYVGMPGLNAHLAFIHRHLPADTEYVMMCSADDWVHPDRAARTIAAFEAHRVSCVGTKLVSHRPAGVYETWFPDRRSREIGPAELLVHQIGCNSSSAWAVDLWDKYADRLTGVMHQDVLLPIFSLVERGYYYVDEGLHHYIQRPSLDNTGAMGQLAAATDERHEKQLTEINNFYCGMSYAEAATVLMETGGIERLPQDAQVALFMVVVRSSWLWGKSHEELILRRIPLLAPRV